MKRSLFAAGTLVLLSGPAFASETSGPGSIAVGRALINQHCTTCHGSEVYTREDRRINDLQRLEAQVRRCDTNLETRLFDDEISSIVRYLNAQYYHF